VACYARPAATPPWWHRGQSHSHSPCARRRVVTGEPVASGAVHCLDAATGALVWKHETNGAIWGCLLLAGDRLYVGNEDGTMTVLRAGRRKQLLAQIEMGAPLYSPPALAGDALYLATANRLYLIATKF
jgi:outer membrane protein assembly factor BamB